jgi:hypothetical protein
MYAYCDSVTRNAVDAIPVCTSGFAATPPSADGVSTEAGSSSAMLGGATAATAAEASPSGGQSIRSSSPG